uniref:Uncharacterized protein n=1 Tax=Lactuca sativa TaxID=4236 RepID=A0A9R1V140_LACSA|nr:hypothetical protein LSAT_V11C700360050 [Lactuca sativa]
MTNVVVDIHVGEVDNSNYFLSPTFKFEQLKGVTKDWIVNTIEFSDGCSNIQIMRVVVYGEQWVGTAHLSDKRQSEFFLMDKSGFSLFYLFIFYDHFDFGHVLH